MGFNLFFKETIPYGLLVEFVNSTFFIGLITILVGSIAWLLYLEQKKDKKRDAASIILMEIRYAERTLDEYRRYQPDYDGGTMLLPTSNWEEYNYLFVKDLDRDELDSINNFYNQCRRIDRAVSQMSLAPQLEAKAASIHEVIVQIAKETSTEDEFVKGRETFLRKAEPDNYRFVPETPKKNIEKALQNIGSITTSTAGEKLKRVAGLE